MLYITVGFVCLCVTVIFLFCKRRDRDFSLIGEHFMITGGSSGIGLAFAAEVVQRGASVTLIARNKAKLNAAKVKLLSDLSASEQKIFIMTADVSADPLILKETVKQAEEALGPVTCLVNCAGTSMCCRFEEIPVNEFEKMINTNLLGSVYITQAVVPLMKKRKRGKIIFFSSLAGLVGIYGYSAYSASKFAVVGMAESLQMEVKPYGIGVTVAFPPDTDTPGFAEEMKSKLTETKLISESSGLSNAQDVAKKTLNDAMCNRFMSHIGFEGWVICTLFSAGSPVSSYVELALQVFTMGILRLIACKYISDCDRIVKKASVESDRR